MRPRDLNLYCLFVLNNVSHEVLPYCKLSVCRLINALLHLNRINSDAGSLVSRYLHICVFSNMRLIFLIS